MAECIFCAIAGGQAPASVVYEDELLMAFLDIAPINPGHTLIIPKQHAVGLADLKEITGMHLFRVAQHLAKAVRGSGVRCEGINLFLADGAAAFQEVFHVHLHIVPRFHGDGFKIEAQGGVQPCRAELDEIAAQIRRVGARLATTG